MLVLYGNNNLAFGRFLRIHYDHLKDIMDMDHRYYWILNLQAWRHAFFPMSYIDCIGSLEVHTGLEDVLSEQGSQGRNSPKI